MGLDEHPDHVGQGEHRGGGEEWREHELAQEAAKAEREAQAASQALDIPGDRSALNILEDQSLKDLAGAQAELEKLILYERSLMRENSTWSWNEIDKCGGVASQIYSLSARVEHLKRVLSAIHARRRANAAKKALIDELASCGHGAGTCYDGCGCEHEPGCGCFETPYYVRRPTTDEAFFWGFEINVGVGPITFGLGWQRVTLRGKTRSFWYPEVGPGIGMPFGGAFNFGGITGLSELSDYEGWAIQSNAALPGLGPVGPGGTASNSVFPTKDGNDVTAAGLGLGTAGASGTITNYHMIGEED